MFCTSPECAQIGHGQKAITRKYKGMLEVCMEFSNWIASMKYKVRIMCTDAEAIFVHGSFTQHCERANVRISHSSLYLKETNGQTEHYSGDIMDMTRDF